MRMLMYLSRMTVRMSDEEVAQIAHLSAVNNSRRDVTGILVKVGNIFLQVIEGTDASLDSLMATIGADKRHTDIRIIENHHSEQRLFSNWNMALFNADEKAVVGDDEFDELRSGIQNIVAGYASRPESMQSTIKVLPMLLARYAAAAHMPDGSQLPAMAA